MQYKPLISDETIHIINYLGSYKTALVLNHLIYYTYFPEVSLREVVEDYYTFSYRKIDDDFDDLWIIRTAGQIAKATNLKKHTVRLALKTLIEKDIIQSRRNPYLKQDPCKQYKVNFEKIHDIKKGRILQ